MIITITLDEKRKHDIEIGKKSIIDKNLPEGFIITDTNVFKVYKKLINTSKGFVIKAGEQSKTGETYIEIAKHLPKDTKKVIALGGGVVGDLAGFTASTYKRGIPLIQIPTTLLAMVDSSIGGKNGVNLGEKKNYLGTIYQPEKILIDIEFLKTLPEAEFSNGVAEIIKYGAIKDLILLERLQSRLSINDEDLEEIIIKCINIKKHFVEQDEKDENIRRALNFGHTIGHALELLHNLPHGQAISIGMVYESRLLPLNEDKTNKIITALKVNGLPTKLPKGADIDRIIELMKADKKGELTFASNETSYNLQINENFLREVLSS